MAHMEPELKRTPKKREMFGDWDTGGDFVYDGSQDDTDTEGHVHSWPGPNVAAATPDPEVYYQQYIPRRNSKKHDWGDQPCSKPGCARLLRDTPQVRWGAEGPMCNACGCKQSRDRAKENGGHQPRLPRKLTYSDDAPYEAAMYADHEAFDAEADAPCAYASEQQAGALLPPPAPLATYTSAAAAAANNDAAAASGSSTRVVKRSGARRSLAAATAAGQHQQNSAAAAARAAVWDGDAPCPAVAPAVPRPWGHASQLGISDAARYSYARGGSGPSAAWEAANAGAPPPPHRGSPSASSPRRSAAEGPGSPAQRGAGSAFFQGWRGGSGSPGSAAAAAAAGQGGGEGLRCDSPGASTGSLWDALLAVTQADSDGMDEAAARQRGKRRAADIEDHSDEELSSARAKRPARSKLSRFGQEAAHGAGEWELAPPGAADEDVAAEDVAAEEEEEEPATPLAVSHAAAHMSPAGRPIRDRRKHWGDDYTDLY